MCLFPLAWFAPLAEAGVLPWFGGREISVVGAVSALWPASPLLAALVGLLAMAFPFVKSVGLSAIHFSILRPRALPVIEVIGKLSMADVFLVALYIVVAKGTGLGYVQPAWGLWFFTALVIASLVLAHLTRSRLGAGASTAG